MARPSPRRPGRRPGRQNTREAILTAARAAFAERGYDRASIRAIATSAGVDPALVHHYFGTKDELFAATIDFPMNPAEFVPQVLAGDPHSAGERLIRAFLSVWDSPLGAAGVALLRSAVGSDVGARLMREFLETQILRRVARVVGIDPAEAPLRASLIASQVAGLGMIRYVLKLEPLASAPPEVVVAALAPTLQRYLLGDLAADGHPPGGSPAVDRRR